MKTVKITQGGYGRRGVTGITHLVLARETAELDDAEAARLVELGVGEIVSAEPEETEAAPEKKPARARGRKVE